MIIFVSKFYLANLYVIHICSVGHNDKTTLHSPHVEWLDGMSPCLSAQRGAFRAIAQVKPTWYTWYDPLLSCSVGLINSH